MARDANPRDSVRQITWTFSQDRPRWDNFPPMPTARFSVHLEFYHDTIFAVGGRSGKRPVSAVESLELKTNQWTSWMNIPNPRVFSCIAMTSGNLIITGGLGVETKRGFKRLKLVKGQNLIIRNWTLNKSDRHSQTAILFLELLKWLILPKKHQERLRLPEFLDD